MNFNYETPFYDGPSFKKFPAEPKGRKTNSLRPWLRPVLLESCFPGHSLAIHITPYIFST